MGRIADALKRAERERAEAAAREPAGATVPGTGILNASPGQQESVDSTEAEPLVDVPLIDIPTIPPLRGASPPPAVIDGLSESLIPYHERSSLITEQYRSLRTRLLSQNPHYEHRIMAITSAIPKEGKSVTTLNLGCILAEIRHLRVIVVDADFRRGTLARMLNQPSSPGFAEVLRGECSYSDAIRSTPIPNLMFMPAGDMKNRPAAELLASAASKPIFQRLENEFHYVVVDTPPATTVTDVGIIGQFCSGVIIVVKMNYTDELAAKKTVRLLQSNNIPILGCLLVGRDSAGGGFGYGNGGNYYRYYSEYYSKADKAASASR